MQSGPVLVPRRRLDAARKIGLRSVPIVPFTGDDLAALRAVVESNRNCEKTNEQKAREYTVLPAVQVGQCRQISAHLLIVATHGAVEEPELR